MAGARAATRAGQARLSFHLYTTEADVDRSPETLPSRLTRPSGRATMARGKAQRDEAATR